MEQDIWKFTTIGLVVVVLATLGISTYADSKYSAGKSDGLKEGIKEGNSTGYVSGINTGYNKGISDLVIEQTNTGKIFYAYNNTIQSAALANLCSNLYASYNLTT